jgi:uncharacterized protein YidB (DUF937 family)
MTIGGVRRNPTRASAVFFFDQHKEKRQMAREGGFPSMTALLALLAIAGYQNRDKIPDWLNKAKQGQPGGPGQGAADQGGGLGGLLGQLGGTSAGGVLSGGLGELLDRFSQNGQGETADSWVKTGPNRPVTPNQLESAIGPDVLDMLAQHTGLSRQELLNRLSRELPEAVDKYTPQGRVPTEAEFSRT